MPSKRELRLILLPLNGSRQETAGDVEVFVIIFTEIVLLPAPGVLVAGRAARVFTNASLRVDAHVLPVTIAANYYHIFLFGNKCAQLVPFMGKIDIGMIVMLAGAIRPDNRSRADEHTVCCIGLRNSLFEPRLLFRTTDGLPRSIGCFVL